MANPTTTPLDELAGFLSGNAASSVSPQNPLGQNTEPSASPSNPNMNPSNPGAWTNPSNPQLNPSLPTAINNPSNPKYNPSMPGATNNPSNYALNPSMPGSMTNPSQPQLNPNYPGSLTNPSNKIHNPDFPVHQEYPRPPGLSDNASLPPAHASWHEALRDPTMPLYHGTTNRALALAQQRGGFHPWDPHDVANEVATHYGLDPDELYNHPYNDFKDWRQGDPRIYMHSDPEVAQHYADSRSEQLQDALRAAHRMMNPQMYTDAAVEGFSGSPQRYRIHVLEKAREEFARQYHEANDIQPQVVRFNVPRASIPEDQMAQMGCEPESHGTYTLPDQSRLIGWIEAGRQTTTRRIRGSGLILPSLVRASLPLLMVVPVATALIVR